MFKKTLATVSVAALAVAEPAAVSAADTRNFSVQLAKCNPCAANAAAIIAPRRLVPSHSAPQGNNPTDMETLMHLPAFFFGENLPRGRQAALFQIAEDACGRRPTLKWTPLSLVFKRFLLRS